MTARPRPVRSSPRGSAPQQLRNQFRDIPPEELSLRWPAVGELRWLLAQLQAEADRQSGQGDGNADPAA
jgi:hypothetical protein